MGVPNVFGSATTSIPLSQLDANFNTGLTIGNTTIGLGNTTTTLGNVILTNATISSPSGIAANAVIYSTSTGNLTGNATIFSVNSGNVGIGTASPSAPLDIQSNSGGTGIRVRGRAAANAGAIRYFANDNTTQKARIESNDTSFEINSIASLPITFNTSDTERMRINAGAPILCLAGGSTTATGTGIAFPATQSASSDVNTLDDYEEGTFTPAFQAQTGSLGSITYENRSGTYTKIGNVVHFALQFYTSAFAAGTGTGDLYIGGLPFTVGSGTQCQAYLGDVRLWNTNNPSGSYIQGSNTFVALLYRTTSNGEVAWIPVSGARTTNPGNVVGVTGFYYV